MVRLIQMAVSMVSTNTSGVFSCFMVSSSTRKTAPMAMRFTLTMSSVIVSIRS